MTRLSVNVNKLATLRNSREKNLPDVTALAKKILSYGAHGITVHPRPDGRHIRLADVHDLHDLIARWNRAEADKVEFNIEGYPSDDFLRLIDEVKPDQCTLVPDPPEALTSNAGWDAHRNEIELKRVIAQLKKSSVRVSLFIDPKTLDTSQEQALLRLKPDRIELYTEAFSDHFHQPSRDSVTEIYRRGSVFARDAGIGVNAGHDLNQDNLGFLISKIPWIDEVSIGHALICEALEQGLETTVHSYLKILKS
ncbi:MAG: pyridoxine 5'-phosphate synthase [Bdellovibrionales bacterium]